MSKEDILARVAARELSIDEASKLLAEDEQKRKGNLHCKVSPKGALSLYGLQRMPVTLYVDQWERLLNFADELKAFIAKHNSELKRK